MTSPTPERLRDVPLFAGLTEPQLVALASWLEVEERPAGKPVLVEDSAGYAFFVLDEGQAHAEHDGQVLEVLERGAVFGEMAFFARDGHRTATVVADTPLRLLTMFGTRFRTMQQELPDVAQRLEQLASERSARDAGATPEP